MSLPARLSRTAEKGDNWPPMRILFWNETFLPVLGGVESMTSALARGLLLRGHEVAVVAEHSSPTLSVSEVIDGITVHRFPFFASLSALAGTESRSMAMIGLLERDVRQFKAAFRPDLVHVNLAGANPLFHLRSEGVWPAATVVALMAPLTEKTAGTPMVKRLVTAAAALVAPSRSSAAHFADLIRRPSDSVAAIFPGIDPEAFDPRRTSRREGGAHIVGLGRLVRDKGFDIAIRAMDLLRGIARLTIVGEGPAEAELRDLVKTLGLESEVDLVGRVNDQRRRAILSSADIMVVTSRHMEFFGMVAAEGALSALPVVASRVGGLAEVVVEEETGILVPAESPESLAAALIRLSVDPELAARMGRAARERALQLFSANAMVERYEELYLRALTPRKPVL